MTPETIRLAPGEQVSIIAAEHTLLVARGDRGIGVCDQRGCWLPPPTEGTSSYALDVIPDHPAYTDHGAGADAVRGMEDGEPIPTYDARESLRFLYETSKRHVLLPAILLTLTFKPSATIREVASAIGRGRSCTGELLDGIREDHHSLWLALSGKRQSSRVQRARRKREREQTGQPRQ